MRTSYPIQILVALLLSFQFSCQPKPVVLNQAASITALGELDENPLLLHAVTTAVDLNKNQMSTLYANQIGANYAMHFQTNDFPTGSQLYQVTWERQPDSLWFGAFIPGKLISVELINFENDQLAHYSLFNAELIHQKPSNDSLRTVQILSQPRAVSP